MRQPHRQQRRRGGIKREACLDDGGAALFVFHINGDRVNAVRRAVVGSGGVRGERDRLRAVMRGAPRRRLPVRVGDRYLKRVEVDAGAAVVAQLRGELRPAVHIRLVGRFRRDQIRLSAREGEFARFADRVPCKVCQIPYNAVGSVVRSVRAQGGEFKPKRLVRVDAQRRRHGGAGRRQKRRCNG